jgi:ubiquinone/menaquinone biosynthesis C-methylase UbiE
MDADPIADLYRFIEYAAFGRALERRRFAMLPLVKDARRILILGEGDGRFVSRLAMQNPDAEIDVVDLSARMLALARERVGSAERIRFYQLDALTDPLPGGGYDLIVTNFFLDCFSGSDAATLIHKLHAALARDGRWLISEFQVPQTPFRRLHAKLWMAVMYRFFRLTTGLRPSSLPPYAELLRSAGLARIHYQESRLGLITSQLWTRYVYLSFME